MSPRLWRAAKPHDHAPFKTVECLAEELEKALERNPKGSRGAEAVRGELAGLRAKGPAPLKSPMMSKKPDYHAGFLAGHLLGTLMREKCVLPPQALIFAVAYGNALVDSSMRESLTQPPPDNAVAAHTAAWLHATDKSGPLDSDLRWAAFSWLCDALQVAINPERRADLERQWQERQGSRGPGPARRDSAKRPPAAAIRVTVKSDSNGNSPSRQHARPMIAFDLRDKAWRTAQQRRNEEGANPLTDPDMRGFLELRVGDRPVLSKAHVSVFAVACRLAQARAASFPDEHPICLMDDYTGTWALHMLRDPGLPIVQVTEIYSGASAPVPVGTLTTLIDAFLTRFTAEADRHIPDLAGWGDLAVLGRYKAK